MVVVNMKIKDGFQGNIAVKYKLDMQYNYKRISSLKGTFILVTTPLA